MSNAIRMKTSYGLQVIATKDLETALRLTREVDAFQDSYNRNILDMQFKNCGWYIINEGYAEPVDSEYDLEEIYKMLETVKK